MKRAMQMAAAMLVSAYGLGISGCGGGGGQGAPGAGTVTGRGKLSARVSFEGTSGHARYLSSRQASQTGDVVEVTLSISGVYSVDGKEFEPVTRTIQVDAATGQGTASLTEVPVGKNHLLEATAKFPGGGEETVAGLIQEVSEGKTTEGVASPRTTPAAAALYGEAAASGKRLSDMPYEKYAEYLTYVDALHADLGLSYGEITPEQVLGYADLTGTPETIAISPEAVTLEVDQQFQFSAVVKDANGKTVTAALEWTADSSIGTITSAGLFTATGAGVGTVSVSTSGGALSAAATVTSELGCEPVCSTNEECSDADALTLDACVNGGTCEAVCENAPIACNTASDCDDGNALTIDTCANGGTAAAVCTNSEPISCNTDSDCYQAKRGASVMPQVTPYCLDGGTANSVCIACRADADCDDADALTLDSCADANLATSACNNTPIACNAASDCDDANQYTEDSCANGGTVNAACLNLEIVCLTDADCGDADALTLDFCNAAGTSASYCDNLAIDCNAPADCDDADPLTLDGCELPGEIDALCVNTPIACNVDADCDDADPNTTDTCIAGGSIDAYCDNTVTAECFADADCDDGDATTLNLCVDPGVCSHPFLSREATVETTLGNQMLFGALNADGSILFLGNNYDSSVDVFDTVNKTFSEMGVSTSLQNMEGGLAFDSTGNRLLAVGGNYNNDAIVSVIDPSTLSEIQTVTLSAPDYYYAYYSTWYYGEFNINNTRALVSETQNILYVPVDAYSYDSINGPALATLNLSDLSQGQTIAGSGYYGGYPTKEGAVSEANGKVFQPTQSEGAYINVFDLNGGAASQFTMPTCCGAFSTAISEANNKLFVSFSQQYYSLIQAFDLTTFQEVSTIPLSAYGNPPLAAFDEAGGQLIANAGWGGIAVIDSNLLEVVDTVPVQDGAAIRDFVVDKVNRKVYAIHEYAISVFSYDTISMELAASAGGNWAVMYMDNDLTISVRDKKADLNSAAPDTVSVSLANETTGEMETTLTLTETGTETGVFEYLLAVDYNFSAGANDDGLMNAAPSQPITGTYVDSLDVSKTVSITDTGSNY